jgi:hypothetical protein
MLLPGEDDDERPSPPSHYVDLPMLSWDAIIERAQLGKEPETVRPTFPPCFFASHTRTCTRAEDGHLIPFFQAFLHLTHLLLLSILLSPHR